MRPLIAFALLVSACAPLNAQKPRFVAFEPAVRNRLAEEWHEDNRYQHERGYCLRVGVVEGQLFDTWRVHYVERAKEIASTPRSLIPICPDSTDAILHTHPPATCADDVGNDCYPGGDGGYQCQPSPNDMNFLRRSKRKFDVVQCGKNQLVPFFRDGERIY